MGILENKKVNNIRTIKLLGLPIYRVEKEKTRKHQSFLGGLIKAEKCFADGCITKEITVLGIPVKKYMQTGNFIQYYLGENKFFSINLCEKFYKQHKKLFKKYDDIYILHANIGESVIFLRLAKAYFAKHNSRKPLIIGLQKYHRDLVKLFLPDIDVVVIERPKLSMYMEIGEYEGHSIRLMFPKWHYDEVEDALRDKNAEIKHFVDQILDRMELAKSDLSTADIKVSELVQKSLLKKLSTINLNLDNFVIFCPEANTCDDLGEDFWRVLKNRYESQGYDVYFNVTKESDRYKDCKQCDLTISEIYSLALASKKIIGLRSGLLDLFAFTGKSIDAIYTNARDRESFNPLTSGEILEGFTMKSFDNVRELDAGRMTKEDLMRVVG